MTNYPCELAFSLQFGSTTQNFQLRQTLTLPICTPMVSTMQEILRKVYSKESFSLGCILSLMPCHTLMLISNRRFIASLPHQALQNLAQMIMKLLGPTKRLRRQHPTKLAVMLLGC